MRKSAVLLIAGAAWSAASYAQTVSSANIVGYAKRILPPNSSYILVGVNFTSSGQQPTLKNIIGTNQLRSASNYANADRIVIWNKENAAYQSYAQYSGDNEFYPCNTAQQWANSSATNPVVPIGTGFWIISAGGTSTTNTIYLSGDAVTASSVDLNLSEGYQLISWPFSSDQDIAAMSVTNLTKASNYANADRIVVWEGNRYQQYGIYTDGKWYPCNTAQEWVNAIAETPRKISLGEGFWFIAKTSKTVTEQNPYYNNL